MSTRCQTLHTFSAENNQISGVANLSAYQYFVCTIPINMVINLQIRFAVIFEPE